MAYVKGTNGSETIGASKGVTNNSDLIEGLGGSDTIEGLGGDDTILGGSGDDDLRGGLGADHLDGGADIDTANYSNIAESDGNGIYVNLATGKAFGGAAEGDTLVDVENVIGTHYGNDVLVGDDAPNHLNGLFGNDSLKGGGGDDTLDGSKGDDYLEGGAGADILDGGSNAYGYTDNDTAAYTHSNAAVHVSLGGLGVYLAEGGHAEGDTLIGIRSLTGSGYGDELWGSDRRNTLNGLGGNDTLKGFGGDDTLLGGEGLDTLLGGDGDDTMNGEGGNDSVDGQADDDTLSGGYGVDSVSGGTGNDLVGGGAGNDKLWGGEGQDRFLFDTPLNAATNVDIINDFVIVDDTIQLDADIFSSNDFTVNNSIAGSQFVIGTAALDGSDRIIYNPATGAVYYDSDGTGAAAAIQFATLSPGLALTNHDFYVIA